MTEPAFDLGKDIILQTLNYKLAHRLWTRHDFSAIDLSLSEWKTFKYLNETADDFTEDINLLPNDAGGLYMFHIRCPIIPGMTEFPVYIGRAQLTEGQNLRKRCKEYFQKYARNNERPKITRMFEYWKDHLYLSFKQVGDNPNIVDYEKRLINTLLLPFNDSIPDVEIKQAIQAFN